MVVSFPSGAMQMKGHARRMAALAPVLLAALLLCQAPCRAQEETCCPTAPPRILVLRGIFEIFSLGMNDLAHKLRCHGYDAECTSWALALAEVNCCDDRPLVVVGHSLGGRMCAWVPRKLKSCGKRVPLVIIVDANLLQPIPSNVDRCVNLYVTNELGIFHGSTVRPEAPGTEVVNWNVSLGQPSMFLGGVNHFDIDATDWVHEIIIREIDSHFALTKPGLPEIAGQESAGTPPAPRFGAATKTAHPLAPPEIVLIGDEPLEITATNTSLPYPGARLSEARVPWLPTRTPYYGSEPAPRVLLRR